MRHSNHPSPPGPLTVRAGWLAVLIGLFVLVVGACGSSTPPSASPTVEPTPAITPDPHLREPVTAEAIYAVLYKAKIGLQCPNATLGPANSKVVEQINCAANGYPLRIIQYTSSVDMTRSLAWTPGDPPVGDQSPYNWAGLNILIELGPISARAPSAPAADRQALAAAIFATLDPLLWPIAQRSVVAIPGHTAAPSAKPTPAPTASARATPKPSAKATARPSAKPKASPKP